MSKIPSDENHSRDLTVSHRGIALKSSCARNASFVFAFSSLPTSRHRTLYLFSPNAQGLVLILFSIIVCLGTLSYNLIDSHHLISPARPGRINSGGYKFTEMSSWCCSISSQWSCICLNGKMCSDGTGPASFKANSQSVPSSNKSPFTASKSNLVSTRLSVSQMRDGFCELQAVKAFEIRSELEHPRISLNRCCQARCIATAHSQLSFQEFRWPIHFRFSRILQTRKICCLHSPVCRVCDFHE